MTGNAVMQWIIRWRCDDITLYYVGMGAWSDNREGAETFGRIKGERIARELRKQHKATRGDITLQLP